MTKYNEILRLHSMGISGRGIASSMLDMVKQETESIAAVMLHFQPWSILGGHNNMHKTNIDSNYLMLQI